MLRNLTLTRFLLCAIGVAGLAGASAFAFQCHRARLSERISSKVDRLALTPPPDKAELEWAVLVYWTHNLHGAAMPQIRASYSELRRLDQYLDAALINGPDSGTIATLWDTYANMSDSGSRYRLKYEPFRDKQARAIAAGNFADVDVESYQGMLDGIRHEHLAK